MAKTKTTTVGKYLAKRLEQIGLQHIFGVPGDYVLGFFDCLEESGIKVICNCNELNAGYAADAYARVKGLGAVCVTYGVGGFSLFNAVTGSFAERLPVIVISGAPRAAERGHHHLLHHTIGDMNLQYNCYEKITAASAVLASPEQAPKQIDDTISACLLYRRPVYIEIPVDIVSEPCSKPKPLKVDTTIQSNKAALDEAVGEAVGILEAAKKPVILAGVEPHRFRIQKELRKFVEHSGYPFVTTILGKTVLPEQHPQFAGVYGGTASWKSAYELVTRADVVLSLGALMTDIQLGAVKTQIDPSRMIAANSDNVRIRHHIFNHVSLKDFINGLCSHLKKGKPFEMKVKAPYKSVTDGYVPVSGRKIKLDRFYNRMNTFINKNNMVLAATGDSIYNASKLLLPQGVLFLDQAFYLSIGYAVPATLGAGLAAPGKRPVTFVGDGAFQMTAQEISTMARQKLNPIIFLMNNDGYTIERVLKDGAYNDINMWKYHRLPEVFGGGWGCEVRTEGELEAALQKALKKKDSLALIEIRIDRWDCSRELSMLGDLFKKSK